MSEVLAAIIGAAIGALATWALDARKAGRERSQQLKDDALRRRQERVSVATALLSDLQRLESLLRQLYHTDRPLHAAGDRPQLFYDHLASEVRRFSASSIHPVAEFFRLSEEVFEVIRDLRARPGQVNDRLQHQTRAAAGFALQALVRARDALVAEGGVVPELPTLEVVRPPDLPTIPPPVFPLSVQQAGEVLPRDLR